MNDHEPMSSNRDCGADAAAYVLGALEPPEAEAFRRHMATCVVCRDEVSSFQGVADQLPLAVPLQAVPRGLKRRVMAEVTRSAPGEAALPDRRRGSRAWGWLQAGFARPALAAAATAVAIALVVVAVTSGGGPSTRVYRAAVTWSGSAKLLVTGSRGELVVSGMPAPPANRVYEVWLQRGQRAPVPTAALFSVTRSGSASVDVPGDLHHVSRIMVTPEPVGGSSVPTRPAVLVASLD
jgi:anti-sigma-K factor RskA